MVRRLIVQSGRRLILVCGMFLVVWLALAIQPSEAGLLGLVPEKPDITTHYISVAYDSGAASLSFTASYGWPETFVVVPLTGEYTIGGTPDFSINLTIPNSGVPTGGTLSIAGAIAELGANSGTLLTGDIAQFGYSAPPGGTGGEVFEFVFNVTGGDLASYYGGAGTGRAGVILSYDGFDFYGNFDNSFTGGGMAYSDTYSLATPEPSSMIVVPLLAVGYAVWMVGRRRLRRTTN